MLRTLRDRAIVFISSLSDLYVKDTLLSPTQSNMIKKDVQYYNYYKKISIEFRFLILSFIGIVLFITDGYWLVL